MRSGSITISSSHVIGASQTQSRIGGAHDGEPLGRPAKGAQIPPLAGQLGDLEGEKRKNFQPSRMLDGTTPQQNQGGGAGVGNCGSSAPS